mmetsp:Transcript_20/g.51  ORF Transcript_20/g.51 Transcript_20/m.51 type:complete len:213 (+) Transcript_20:139-777(+)
MAPSTIAIPATPSILGSNATAAFKSSYIAVVGTTSTVPPLFLFIKVAICARSCVLSASKSLTRDSAPFNFLLSDIISLFISAAFWTFLWDAAEGGFCDFLLLTVGTASGRELHSVARLSVSIESAFAGGSATLVVVGAVSAAVLFVFQPNLFTIFLPQLPLAVNSLIPFASSSVKNGVFWSCANISSRIWRAFNAKIVPVSVPTCSPLSAST